MFHSKKPTWTVGAIECYKRGYDCVGCLTGLLLESGKCQMKESCFKLLEAIGRPPKDTDGLLPWLKESDKAVINAILDGAETYSKMAQMSGLAESVVKGHITQIKKLVRENGYVFEITNPKKQLPELIEYLMELKRNRTINRQIKQN